MAKESMVLLKNDGILPLNKDGLKTIGVIGPNADSRTPLVGQLSWGHPPVSITLLEGIQDFVGEDVRVYYSEGCHIYKDSRRPWMEAGQNLGSPYGGGAQRCGSSLSGPG